MSTNVKPAPRRAPRKVEPEEEQPAVSEQLADEVAAELEDYPEGSPELRPVLRIPRRDRSAYYRAAAAVSEQQKRLTGLDRDDDTPIEVTLTQAAEQADLMAAIEDMLATVAADQDAYRAWAAEADDVTLAKVFNLYQRKSQPGEAQRSSS